MAHLVLGGGVDIWGLIVRDDYDERIRESNEYLERRRDAFDAETAAAARRDEFYDKLIGGDHDGLRSMFGIEPGVTDLGGERVPRRNPSLQDRLRRSVSDFSVTVGASRYVSRDVAERWVDEVRSLDLDEYLDGHLVIDRIEDELGDLRLETKPVRDIFSMSPSSELHHMRSFESIEYELSRIRRLLDDVKRFAEGTV